MIHNLISTYYVLHKMGTPMCVCAHVRVYVFVQFSSFIIAAFDERERQRQKQRKGEKMRGSPRTSSRKFNRSKIETFACLLGFSLFLFARL